MEATMQFPEIPFEREIRINKIVDDESFHRLLDKMPAISARILRRIVVLGVITPSILGDVCFSVPQEENERYQFLRMIQNAKDVDAVVDAVLADIEVGLQMGELP
jgi:hypothetical protein